MRIVWFTFDGNGFSVAKKLQEEGHEVLVGQAETYKELGIDKEEDPKDQKQRMQTWEGMIEKTTAQELLKTMESFEDKDDWGVICDFNNLFALAEKAQELGFASENGRGFYMLPTREQFELESDRDKGKNFVQEHYQIRVGEKHDFKTIDEGIKFLQEAATRDQIFVLKAYNDDLNAIVPTSDDATLAKDELISALASERAGYESQGYLLEEKIAEPLERTPQAVFYDGRPVFYDLDIESKPLLAGDTGPQTGCSANIIVPISEFDPICDMAFPPIVYDMAQKQKGLFVWDASILTDARTGEHYFGEFCANRWGYDSFFTELSMSGSVGAYFEKVMRGENPLIHPFGVAVREFNVKKTGGISVIHKEVQDVWMFDVKATKSGGVASIGYCWDLLVATGAGKDLDEALDICYERLKSIAFTGGGYRPRFDFVSEEYPTSMMTRYNEGVGKLFSGTKYEGIGIDERLRRIEKEMGRIKKDADTRIAMAEREKDSLKGEVMEALAHE